MNYIKLFEEFSKKSITTEEFITKSKKIYGDKYDYSKTKFFYSKNSCTLKLDYDTYQYYGVKNLSKISKNFDLNKVLIIDDIQKTAVNNYGNLIRIKPFESNLNDT